MDAETAPVVEKPSLRCAADRFDSMMAAISWAMDQIDQRFPDGAEKLMVSRYWHRPDGSEVDAVEMFAVTVSGTVP